MSLKPPPSLTTQCHLTVSGHAHTAFFPSIQRRNTLQVNRLNKSRVGARRALTTLSPTGPNEVNGLTEEVMKMRIILAAAVAIAPLMAQESHQAKRLDQATAVLSEIMATPDKAIPQDLFDKAHCVVIVPGEKSAAFVVGGKFGTGYLSCRKASGTGWSAPATIRIEGGSVGFQIGGKETDVVMFVMNAGGEDKLLQSKFTLGADASVAAGPVGRSSSAQTDAQMHAEILSWSRSQGVFAGISLQGATLRPDVSSNTKLYGRKLDSRQIVTTDLKLSKAAARLIAELNRDSDHEHTTAAGSGQ
jgi:lipid-binding SYLF domain-containing protein